MSLFDKWNEFSRRGGLDTAGCQILADWKKEADQLRAQLQQAEAREAALQEALQRAGEALLDPMYYDKVPDWITDVLSSPSQPSRYREMEKIVVAARKYRKAEIALDEIIKIGANDLDEQISLEIKNKCDVWTESRRNIDDALTAYDKTGEGVPADAK